MTEKIKPREKPHYVNNRQFSYAVVDYFKIPSDIDVHNLYFDITPKFFP